MDSYTTSFQRGWVLLLLTATVVVGFINSPGHFLPAKLILGMEKILVVNLPKCLVELTTLPYQPQTKFTSIWLVPGVNFPPNSYFSIWVCKKNNQKVYSQENFTRFTGQDVLLPCFYSGHGKPLGDVEVFWRTKDDRDVYSILKAQTDLSGQDLQFRDRTSAFPEAYGEGNFSILLKNVDVSDTGRYDCFMPTVASGALSQVELTVREKPVEPAVEPDYNIKDGGVSLRIQNLSFFLFLLLGQLTLLLR